MPCSPSQVLNPESKRCVRRDGRIGKRVLASGCRQDQIRNPSTNRCVLRSGRVGRSLKKPRSPFSDRKAYSGPLAAAQTSFLLKELRRRRPKRLDPPSAARLTLADLRRARRGEAEFQVILPTRPFQISVLSKTSLKRFGERYFDPPDDDKEKKLCHVAPGVPENPFRDKVRVWKITPGFNKWLHTTVD